MTLSLPFEYALRRTSPQVPEKDSGRDGMTDYVFFRAGSFFKSIISSPIFFFVFFLSEKKFGKLHEIIRVKFFCTTQDQFPEGFYLAFRRAVESLDDRHIELIKRHIAYLVVTDRANTVYNKHFRFLIFSVKDMNEFNEESFSDKMLSFLKWIE